MLLNENPKGTYLIEAWIKLVNLRVNIPREESNRELLPAVAATPPLLLNPAATAAPAIAVSCLTVFEGWYNGGTVEKYGCLAMGAS
jgi:hypothetical protein